jgi:hypothetical protein
MAVEKSRSVTRWPPTRTGGQPSVAAADVEHVLAGDVGQHFLHEDRAHADVEVLGQIALRILEVLLDFSRTVGRSCIQPPVEGLQCSDRGLDRELLFDAASRRDGHPRAARRIAGERPDGAGHRLHVANRDDAAVFSVHDDVAGASDVRRHRAAWPRRFEQHVRMPRVGARQNTPVACSTRASVTGRRCAPVREIVARVRLDASRSGPSPNRRVEIDEPRSV